MLSAILVFGSFAIIAALMITKKIPTMVALPILAVSIAVVCGVPWVQYVNGKDAGTGIMKGIIEAGAIKMAGSYAALMIGAWIGQYMNHVGISKTIIKTAAELGGDRPFLVTIFVCIAIALLYTTVSGLGAVIMAATIALPILISVGVPKVMAGCIFLFSYAIGLSVNLANWTYFVSVTGMKYEQVQTFSFALLALTAITTLVFVIVNFKKTGIKFAWAAPASDNGDEEVFYKAPAVALLTPLVPMVLVVVFKWAVITSFLASLLYCFLTMLIFGKEKNISKLVSLLSRSAIDGVADTAVATMIMLGIGMLANALNHPIVTGKISGFVQMILPSSPWGFVLFFALLAPLALYRGPLNIWGMGAGIATIMVGLKILPPQAITAAFVSCERVQVVGDPTNSHNVWISSYVGTDTNQILVKVFPYIWALAACSVITGAILYLF
jgi:hypothetical protein